MKPLKRFITLFSSCLFFLIPKQIATACGFGVYAGEYRFWLLQPDIVNEPDLTPFFFSTNYLFNGDQYAAEEPSLKRNIEEWYNAIHGAASKADIDTLLNAVSPTVFLAETDSSKNKNTFYKWLLLSENKAFYNYMLLSKKVEQLATNPDPWEERQLTDMSVQNVIDEAINLSKSQSSKFLKLRTAYQLQRLYSLNNQPEKASRIYDSLIKPVKSDSWIKTAALYKITDNNPMSSANYNYILSKVFEIGGYHRTSCLVHFQTKAYKETLPLAKNQHERNVISAMNLFNYPGRCLSSIQTIYNTEPKYKEISFLLLREMNKVEDWLVTSKVTDFGPAVYYNDEPGNYYNRYDAAVNRPNDEAYAKQLYSFLLRLIYENKRRDIGLIRLFAAHLAMLQGNNTDAQTHLTVAKNIPHLPANVETQIRINDFLLQVKTAKKFTPFLAQALMEILETSDHQLAIYNPAIMKEQLILYTARQIIAKGDKATGILLLGKTERVWGQLPQGSIKTIYQELEEKATSEDFSEIIALIDKKKKSPFEKFITGKKLGGPYAYNYFLDSVYAINLDKNKILDCKATYYIKVGYLDSALQTLKILPDSFWNQQPYASCIGGNPFYLNINSPHVVTPDEGMSCNKKEVVEEMLLLQRKIKDEPSKAAEYNYQLANALYNMTYYGKNWLMMKQWWSSGEMGYDDIKQTPFNDLYFGCTRAKKYYLKAMRETTDKKLAALCCFMAGECDKNYQEYSWYAKQKGWDKRPYNRQANRYVKELEDDKYYNEIVKECEVYASYSKRYAGLN